MAQIEKGVGRRITLSDGSEAYSPWVCTKEAAVYLGLTKRFLDIARCENRGPAYYKAGSKTVRYNIRDLDDWMYGVTPHKNENTKG